MPIIKNGGNISIKAAKLGHNKISLTNTCAFDSTLQLFIAAYFDKEEIKSFISSQESNIFLKLVLDAATRITQQSYKLRAQILKEIFTNKILSNTCILVDCAVNVGSLCNKLFAKCPFFKEISTCSNGCLKREKDFPLLHANINFLIRQDYEALENNIIIQGSRLCCQTDCNGLETTTFSHISPYIMLEVYIEEEVSNIKLLSIPKKIKFTFLEKDYSLVGFVNYAGPGKQTRQSTDNDIGHYTTICYRNNKWINYNDCKDKEQFLNENYIVYPQIFLYAI
ncbi:hypothetical protein ACS0PU_005362 [Formica fusca]